MDHNVEIHLIVENKVTEKEAHFLYKQKKISFFPQVGSTLSTRHVNATVTIVSHVLDTGWNLIVCRLNGPVDDLSAYRDQAEEDGWALSSVTSIDYRNFQ
jgi:hypothetical protein